MLVIDFVQLPLDSSTLKPDFEVLQQFTFWPFANVLRQIWQAGSRRRHPVHTPFLSSVSSRRQYPMKISTSFQPSTHPCRSRSLSRLRWRCPSPPRPPASATSTAPSPTPVRRRRAKRHRRRTRHRHRRLPHRHHQRRRRRTTPPSCSPATTRSSSAAAASARSTARTSSSPSVRCSPSTPRLPPASVATEVNVTSESPLLDTEKTEVAQTIDQN